MNDRKSNIATEIMLRQEALLEKQCELLTRIADALALLTTNTTVRVQFPPQEMLPPTRAAIVEKTESCVCPYAVNPRDPDPNLRTHVKYCPKAGT